MCLFMFKDNLLTFNHIDILCSSSLIWHFSLDKSLPLENRFESSANGMRTDIDKVIYIK